MKKFISLVLAVTMICSIFVLPAVAAETDNRVWFEITGNSRLFVKTDDEAYTSRQTYDKYLPGVDFTGYVAAPTGDFATDQAAVIVPSNGGTMIPYTIGTISGTPGEYTIPVFTTGEDSYNYWTINGTSYRVKPTENVIKVTNKTIDTSALTDAEKIARYGSLKEATIDVEDGQYNSVGILVGTNADTTSTKVTVTLVYSDDTTESETVAVETAGTTGNSYLTGSFRVVNFTNDNAYSGATIGFVPVTIEANPSKTLIAIKIKDGTTTSYQYSLHVVSAWGVKKSFSEYAAELNAEIDAINVNTVTKEECAALRLKIAELIAKSNGTLTATDFDTTKLDEAEERFEEEDRVEKLEQKEMYYYPIEYNRDAFATYAEVLEYGVFDSGYTFPEKDLAGNPLDTTAPWFGYKGLAKTEPGNVAGNKSIFLIDSIEGVEGQVSAQRYKSASDYTITSTSKTLQINGVENYELQSTEANGAKNYIYKAGEFKYKFGPIGGTGDRLTATGGYNVHLLAENGKYKFERTQDGANKFGALFTLTQNNEGTSYAALEKVVVTYNDGRAAETKYLVMTAMNSDANIYADATYDGDRLARVVVAVPKSVEGADLDHSTGSVLKANAKIVSESNSEELIGKAITIEDVTFPADFVVGESMPIADFALARNYAVYNNRRYCPQGYANHYEFDFGEDVTSIEYQGGINYAKDYTGAIFDNNSNSMTAFIPVTIEGASEDYLYYARFGRPCGYTVALLAASSAGGAIGDRIDEVNAQLEDAETKEEIITALDAMKALIDVSEGAILAKDFNTAAALAKLTAHIKADIEAAKSVAELEALEDEIEAYLTAFGSDTTELEAAIAEKLVALERIEELTTGEKYDLAEIDWNYKDNAQYLINAFELSSVVSIESTTDYYASISGQKYINTASATSHDTIAEVLATEEKDTDGDDAKNYTGSPRGMAYYPTDKIQTATGTFPAADGKYYITTPKGVKFRIDGVTSTVGGNTFNAGYVTMNPDDEDGGSIYKVDFDGETKYNSVNLLVAGVGEPVWNGSTRQAIAAQANIYYADGTSEKQLVVIPSVWGFAPTLAGKLKTQDQISGINVKHPYVNITSTIAAYCSGAKFDWTPSNTNEEIFSVGSYMTTANKNTLEERHEFTEMTNKAGAMASVSVDTKGKAVDYIEITHTEDEVLEAAGAFNAATNGDTHVYWLPISNEDVLELVGEDKAGVLTGLTDAKISDCDFYIRLQRNAQDSGRGATGFIMAASGEKKYASLYAYIEEAEKAMSAVTENSSIEEAAAAKEIYDLAKSQAGIVETDFNASIVESFNAVYEVIRQKTDVKGELSVNFIEGMPATVNVELTNLAELAGKPYAVLLTYIDEKGFVVGSESFTGVSTVLKNETATFTATSVPEKAVKAKAYIWKALSSLKPLGEAVEVNKSSYAVDRYFDVATGTFKADAEGKLNVLFLGDSLTEGSSTYEIDGENADRPDHWTNVIAMYLKENLPLMQVNVLNGGIGGTTTSFQAPIMDGYALTCEPDIVFIQNVNNYNSTSTADDVASVENIVRNLLKLEKQPTIIYYHAYSPYTPENDGNTYPVTVQANRTNESQKKHRDDIDALLEKYNIASLDYISYFLDYTDNCTDEIMLDLYNPNNVHPKTAGYKLMGTYATGEFALAPEAFFKKNTLISIAETTGADVKYAVTYPNDSRFTYKNFTVFDKVEDATANIINKRQYAFPFNGNVAQTTVGGAEIEFKTTAQEVVVYYVNPTEANRTNTVKIYVDGEFKVNGAGANAYASNYGSIKVSGLDGNEHTIKLVTDEPSGNLNIFNFMFLAEKK